MNTTIIFALIAIILSVITLIRDAKNTVISRKTEALLDEIKDAMDKMETSGGILDERGGRPYTRKEAALNESGDIITKNGMMGLRS